MRWISNPVDSRGWREVQAGDCNLCNRLRLTANGIIKPCLFDNIGFSIREHGVSNALRKAIHVKPEKGTVNSLNKFHQHWRIMEKLSHISASGKAQMVDVSIKPDMLRTAAATGHITLNQYHH